MTDRLSEGDDLQAWDQLEMPGIEGYDREQLSLVFSNPGMSLKGQFRAGSFGRLLFGFFHIYLVVVVAV